MTREVRRGTYVLLLDIPLFEGEIGLLGDVRLDAGRYCYVGSAMGGLDQRLSRHLHGTEAVVGLQHHLWRHFCQCYTARF